MSGLLQNVRDLEAAREDARQPSFMTQLFAGEPDFRLLLPFPRPGAEDQATGDAYCARIGAFLRQHVDAAEIERTGVIPREVMAGLAELGAFGLTIPREYGGLGLSQTNYNRVLALVASHCDSLALMLSAHQSIGVSRPLLTYGTEQQKQTWLPRIARGAISAFALTEPTVGSDPAHLATTAERTDDGRFYVLNGDKLWCTNGTIADVIVVLARVDGKITAFILEMRTPGVEIRQRCEFLGCRGIENGWIHLHDVRVPVENVIGEVGKGLKIALSTLNTGRVSLAGLCLGMAKQVLGPTVDWAGQRETFGRKIGEHELNTHKLARLAADLFAMQAVNDLVVGLVDRGQSDYRVEAAVAKLFCSERLWSIVDTAMQIRGGRGYEKASSLQARGEPPIPIEQIFRDARLYLIGEGASEILKLFIAREVWDPHVKRAASMLSQSGLAKLTEVAKLGRFYAGWYLRLLGPAGADDPTVPDVGDPTVRQHLIYVRDTSRRLARQIFFLMARHGPGLETRQALVARLADVGIDLFVITATALYSTVTPNSAQLERLVFEDARHRIEASFRALGDHADAIATPLGRDVLAGKYRWLLEGSLAAAPSPVTASGPPRTSAG